MTISHKAFYIYFATSLAAIAIIVGLLIKLAPLTVSHAVYFCQQIITNSNYSLPHSIPILLVLGFLLILISGVILFIVKAYSTKVFVHRLLLNKIETPKKILELASQVGLENILDIIMSKEYTSFSHGLFRSRICISTATINLLNEDELKAVLLHESSHINNHDPIKIVLTQVISSMFFFLPVLKDFQRLFTLAKEVDADKLVIKVEGTSRNLRSALKKLLIHTTSDTILVAPFMQNIMLEERVMILTGSTEKIPLNLSVTRISISLCVAIAASLFLSFPLYAMETSPTEHSYLVCPGDKCASYCIQKDNTSNDLLPKSSNLSSMYEVHYK